MYIGLSCAWREWVVVVMGDWRDGKVGKYTTWTYVGAIVGA